MISKRAEEYIDENIADSAYLVNKNGFGWAVVVRYDAKHAVKLAEDEIIEKAGHLFYQFISSVFQVDMPKKMAEEFKQKLMEE